MALSSVVLFHFNDFLQILLILCLHFVLFLVWWLPENETQTLDGILPKLAIDAYDLSALRNLLISPCMVVHLVTGLRRQHEPIVERNHFSIDGASPVSKVLLLFNDLQPVTKHLEAKDWAPRLVEMGDVHSHASDPLTYIDARILQG